MKTPATLTPGKPAPRSILIDPDKLIAEYYSRKPDPATQGVKFGTSGHRGSSLAGTFTEAHILAITQAICDYRASKNITGPLYLGMDTHALSAPAQRTALEVLAANKVQTIIQAGDGFTPTPVISHAILTHNRDRRFRFADGVVITPSHNPPADGGFKYNPPDGGPADSAVTDVIGKLANAYLKDNNVDVLRLTYDAALRAHTTSQHDMVTPYVRDLGSVIDMEAIRAAGLKLGADPLGGASVGYWQPIAEMYRLNITVVNPEVDPTFSFMTLDHDGKIRMDCSSPYAMAKLLRLKNKFDLAFGNDPDSDRHGIVTPSAGLLNPNHYLAVAIDYLFKNREGWPASAAVGKTMVSSAIIDRVAARLRRKLYEVPVGFKFFAPGLFDGSLGFGGEESAGASFLRMDGRVWTTDKDGIILNLLAAEILARTGKDPGEHYQELTGELGAPLYKRVDAPATPAAKKALAALNPKSITATTLAGEKITAKLTRAPGNKADFGGLKVTTANGWFAARPSGTEDVYKIYAESFKDEAHLEKLIAEAKKIVSKAG